MSGYDQPMATAGESEYVGNPESPSTHKKASILGKLKDKTKKAGSRIKSKVGRRKNPDGSDAPIVDSEEHEGEEEHTSDDSPSPASPASPATTAPRELGSTFQSEPSRYGSGNGAAKEDSEAVPDVSGRSLDEPAGKDVPEPSVTEKTSEASEGAKDVMYDDGAGDTAGALGVDEADSKEPESEEKPVTEKASGATEGVGAETEEVGDRGYDAATDGNDAVVDEGNEVAEQTKETSSREEPSSTDTAESNAYETKDATESKAMETEEAADQSKASESEDGVESKAEDLNNATHDSETYTEKADNAAVDAKDTVGDTSGMNEPSSEGPSMEEKAKETLGVAEPSEGPSVDDQAKESLGSAVDTTKDQPARAGDEASAATEAAKESTGSSLDTTKDQTARTGDEASAAAEAAEESTGSALDTTKDHTAQAKEETAADAATPKQEDKAVSEKITESLGALPAKASDTAASVTESAKSPTTTTPGTLTQAPAAHSSDPASPGILGKIGGLFGFGAKAPEDHSHDATH